jgi:polysaccharide deacetylase 2 family uncharacterized protein YibQ
MKRLAVTTLIVFGALALVVAALSLFAEPDAGEPTAVVAIDPGTMPSAAMESSPAASPAMPGLPSASGSAGTPPGFIISEPPASVPNGPAAPGQSPLPPQAGDQPVAPMPQRHEPGPLSSPEQQAALDPSVSTQTAAAPSAAGMQQVAATGEMSAGVDASAETGSITLPSAPIPALVEESQYGPLPKVAADGTRPLEAYARPSHYAAANAGGPVRVAVLITGMGLSDAAGGGAIKGLPAPISLAYGAYGRNLQDGVDKARAAGHEVLLQVPLEPMNYPTTDPGPHTLLTSLPPAENMKRLQWLMSRFTGYVGVTNLMGAKFEATQDSLVPVLEEIKARGLLYVDDGTSDKSTAGQIATTLGLDYAAANVQIDGAQSLAKLEALAKERGCAIGVASAKPATFKQLTEWASKLESKGIVLIPVSAAVRSQRQS